MKKSTIFQQQQKKPTFPTLLNKINKIINAAPDRCLMLQTNCLSLTSVCTHIHTCMHTHTHTHTCLHATSHIHTHKHILHTCNGIKEPNNMYQLSYLSITKRSDTLPHHDIEKRISKVCLWLQDYLAKFQNFIIILFRCFVGWSTWRGFC